MFFSSFCPSLAYITFRGYVRLLFFLSFPLYVYIPGWAAITVKNPPWCRVVTEKNSRISPHRMQNDPIEKESPLFPPRTFQRFSFYSGVPSHCTTTPKVAFQQLRFRGGEAMRE